MFDESNRHLASQVLKANDLKLEVEAANRAAGVAQASAARNIDAMLREERELASTERQALIIQMSALINASSLEQEKRLAARMGTIQTELSVSSDKLNSATSDIT